MRSSEHIAIGLSAVMLMGGSAGAVEVSALLGSWGGDSALAYDCAGTPGSEVMPVTVSRGEQGEISVGAYEWGCTAPKWETRGTSIWADTTCGHEGTEEVTNERVELALSSDGRLILTRDGAIDMLTRCPAEVQ